jgi:hypothetical protein
MAGSPCRTAARHVGDLHRAQYAHRAGTITPVFGAGATDGSTSSIALENINMTVNRLRCWSAAAATCLAAWSVLDLCPAPVEARVTRIVIEKKESPAYSGKSFGAAGPYERNTDRAFGELDPRDARNAVISWICTP